MVSEPFVPRWASPPGATIRGVLSDRNVSVETFATEIGMPRSTAEELLSGQRPISIEMARRLTSYLGASVEFWITRDGQYRDDLARLDAAEWVKTLPTSDMTSRGWIPRTSAWYEEVDACLRFFDVPDVEVWRDEYETAASQARYRLSLASPLNRNAMIAWLRQGEIEAMREEGASWRPTQFSQALVEVKDLTKRSNPAIFVPQLQGTCAECGVVLTLLRSPKGCPVSGAARLLSDGRAQIIMTARYLADDHFWFTFFHESAHLLLHDLSETYVDELDRRHSDVTTDEEREADKFATDYLVPPEIRSDFPRRPTPLQVYALAKRAGVSSGIVVGQLQHAGILGYDSKFNSLKRRYKWSGSTLEKA